MSRICPTFVYFVQGVLKVAKLCLRVLICVQDVINCP